MNGNVISLMVSVLSKESLCNHPQTPQLQAGIALKSNAVVYIPQLTVKDFVSHHSGSKTQQGCL
jgi:hypothetical protein